MAKRSSLTKTEIRMYIILTLIYEKILDDEPSYQMGFFKWSQLKPDILENIGMSDDTWAEISDFGDVSDELQDILGIYREKYVDLTKDQILEDISIIKFE